MKFIFLLCALLLVCCAPAAAAATYTPTPWDGEYGAGVGGFNYPSGVAVDTANRVYVADSACDSYDWRFVKFDGSTYRTQWGGEDDSVGWENTQFLGIVDIAADSTGKVYLSDVSNCIKVFKSDANTVECRQQWTVGPEDFSQTIGGLGIDSSGNVYVADPRDNRIKVFGPDGVPGISWGSWNDGTRDDQFNQPTDVAVSGDYVYVADAGNNRILKFTRDGKYSDEWGARGTSNAPDSPDDSFDYLRGIATTADGSKVFATDAGARGANRFWVFDAAGTYLACWDQSGASEGQLTFPRGIAADSAGNVYVVDGGNNRVQKFVPVDGPTAKANGPYTGTEGTAVSFSAEGSTGSAGTEIVRYEWDFDNDGEYDDAEGLTASWTWPDGPVTATIGLRVTDGNGNMDTDTALVTISNVAPTVNPVSVPGGPPLNPVRVGTEIPASATFIDPGTLDTHTAFWNWDDEAGSSAGTVSGGAVSGTHTYTVPGIYSPSVTVTDKDGDTDTGTVPASVYIVVYDPNGGSATGGGWFDSPVGKAHFAFVSKYKTGATVPDSSVEFSLKQAKIDFKSTSVKWLVVDGSKATYLGVGTLNGAGEYEFLLSAIDNGSSDLVRMKIWNASGVVYDTQPGDSDAKDPSTGIGGGSIVIHP